MYFSTSKDVLFIVLAFAVLWITIFLSWLLYYVVLIVRDARDTVHAVKKATDAVERAAETVKGKFDGLLGIATVVGEGIKMIAGKFIQSRMDDDESPKKKKKE